VVALYAVLAITLMHRPPWFLTAVVMVGAFLVIVGWAWFQLDVPGRRPHNVAERWLPTVACAQLAAPGTTILDGLPASTGKALAMSAFPAIALAAYLVCRWRR